MERELLCALYQLAMRLDPRPWWEVVQFFEVTGMVDHLPECWTTWTGTVDQITGMGQ